MTKRMWLLASMGLAVVLLAGTRVHRTKAPVDECCAGKGSAASHKAGDCPTHKGTQALPPGHPDVNGPRVAAPPLDDKILAKGKVSECPFLVSQPRKAMGEPGAGEIPVVQWINDQKAGGTQ